MKKASQLPSYTLITVSPDFNDPIPLGVLRAQIEEGIVSYPPHTQFRTATTRRCGLWGDDMVQAYLSTVACTMYPTWERDFMDYVTEEDKRELAAVFMRIVERGAPITSLLDGEPIEMDIKPTSTSEVSSHQSTHPLPQNIPPIEPEPLYEPIPIDDVPSAFFDNFVSEDPPNEPAYTQALPPDTPPIPSLFDEPAAPPPKKPKFVPKPYDTLNLFD